ncbi:MAG: hypothetical protein ACREBU_18650 [Nitrososphaera sp.]
MKREWTPGQRVKIGFLSLTVVNHEKREDRAYQYFPRAWELRDDRGRAYKFTPYHGLKQLGGE